MDTLYEIFATLKRNKLRTALTGFSVAWGIFMLIVLLGSGNGLMNGVSSNFSKRADNVINIYGGQTSIAHQGFKEERFINLTTDDLDYLRNAFPKTITAAVAYIRAWDQNVSYGTDYINTSLNGVYPEYTSIDGVKVLSGKGRNINQLDLLDKRKVAVIHPKTAEILFKDENPIGKSIKIGSVLFQVVGVYDADEMSDQQTVQVPYSTLHDLFNKGTYIDHISILVEGLRTKEANETFNEKIREAMAQKKQFNPQDLNAIWLWNRYENYLQTEFIFNAIRIAIWIIGLFTLISGIVGVSNIMLISVKERSKEFGIRKAIGASPFSILKVVILESILITAIFGYIGMLLGIGLTEGVNYILETKMSGGSGQMQIFSNPTVDLKIAFGATFTLIIAGTLAGFFPAKKAVSIKPVEALSTK